MQFSLKLIMSGFYHGTHDEIISLLNMATHIDKYSAQNRGVVIHTGFVFKIHTGTSFEVLYNCKDNSLVYQPCVHKQLPVLVGLIVQRKAGRYFDTYLTNNIVTQMNQDDGTQSWLGTTEKEIDNINYDHQFEILNNKNEVIAKFPLSKSYDRPIYNGRTEFRKHGSIEDVDPDDV